MQIVQKISKVIDVKFVSLGFIAILAVGAFVFWLSDNPFARTFQIGAALLCIGLCGTSTAVVIRLFRSARLLARITGVIFVAIALLLCGLCAVFLHQNRLILRSDLRATDWQADTQYLADLIPRVHPKPFAHVSVGAYRDNVGDATSKITSGSEAQTEMSLVKLVASLQDGHSTLFPFQPATGFRMLPLQIYLLGDGWYVTDASPRYAHLVGKRIVSVGSERVEEALTIVRPYVGADNEATIEDRAPLYLLCPEVLQALGVSQSADSVRFQVSDERGSIDEVEIRPVSLVGYLYWYFEPLQQWKHKPAQEQLPLYRQYL